MSTNMKTTNKDEIMRQILALLRQLVDDGAPKLPAVNLKDEGNALGGGWGKALIKAVSEKEIETKRGPATKLALKLTWTENGETQEVWASTFNDGVRSQAAKFDKGDRVEVQLVQSGGFYNLMGIREAGAKTCGISNSELPF
jgi:hypothetical protein